MKQLYTLTLFATISGLSAIGMVNGAAAQTATTNAAGNQWGTTPGGIAVNGAYESALMHNQLGVVAGEVNSARVHGLVGLPGSNLSITSVGSETIVSDSIAGQNISSSINATQTSSNSGNVSNTGQITPSP